MSGKNELHELSKLARDQGWTIETTNGGHLKWIPPEGEFLITSSTPSDANIIKTIKSDLSKLGLIVSPDQWKQFKRREKKIEAFMGTGGPFYPVRVLDGFRTGQLNLEGIVTLADIGGMDLAEMTLLCRMYSEYAVDKGATVGNCDFGMADFRRRCKKCNKEFLDPFACFKHEVHSACSSTPDPAYEYVPEPDPEVPKSPGWARRRNMFLDAPPEPVSVDPSQIASPRNLHIPDTGPPAVPVQPPVAAAPTLPQDEPQAPVEPDDLGAAYLEKVTRPHPLTPDDEKMIAAMLANKGKLKADLPDHDALWDHLELMFEKPIPMTRESMKLVEAWMEATLALFMFQAEQEGQG